MNKKHAREALDIYKRFLIRMDRVGEFLKTAEKFGIDKQDIPDLARVSKRVKNLILMFVRNQRCCFIPSPRLQAVFLRPSSHTWPISRAESRDRPPPRQEERKAIIGMNSIFQASWCDNAWKFCAKSLNIYVIALLCTNIEAFLRYVSSKFFT